MNFETLPVGVIFVQDCRLVPLCLNEPKSKLVFVRRNLKPHLSPCFGNGVIYGHFKQDIEFI